MRRLPIKRPVMHHANDCAYVLAREELRAGECDCRPEDLRTRVAELENALRLMLASATPNEFNHPTMSAAWRHATNVLERR